MSQGSYALFQLGGAFYYNNFPNDFVNTTQLEQDFKALFLADFMMEVFKKRAIHYDVTLPSMLFLISLLYLLLIYVLRHSL